MYDRLSIIRELLSEKGSIYIHLDRHTSHYVKIMCDENFGYNNLRNEIIFSLQKLLRISRGKHQSSARTSLPPFSNKVFQTFFAQEHIRWSVTYQ